MDPHSQTGGAHKAVIVISSHVVRGTVGNRAVVFALEALGFPVWALQTITLPWHPGHGPSTRIVPDDGQFSAIIDDLCSAPWLSEVGGIVSGYIGSAAQAGAIAKLVGAVKDKVPDALYLCDPVIGDAAGLYVPHERAEAIKSDLLPIADIATPNRFELAWLTDHDIETNDAIVKAARTLGPARVLTTSAFGLMKHAMANLLTSQSGCFLAEHRAIDAPINGPGDLSSALMLAHQLRGLGDEEALRQVTASVFEILSQSARHKADELMLESAVSSLYQPRASVQMRTLLIK